MPYPQDDLVGGEGASEGKNQKQDRNNDEQCFFHGITLLGTIFDSLTNEQKRESGNTFGIDDDSAYPPPFGVHAICARIAYNQ